VCDIFCIKRGFVSQNFGYFDKKSIFLELVALKGGGAIIRKNFEKTDKKLSDFSKKRHYRVEQKNGNFAHFLSF